MDHAHDHGSEAMGHEYVFKCVTVIISFVHVLLVNNSIAVVVTTMDLLEEMQMVVTITRMELFWVTLYRDSSLR